ncbi:ABC transporter ATP-binding protein [Nocardioides sp. 503]|uniref:ABC transporter ATP-binding protein n=1 Tax=Nocardioides sp. 503 TaxID=2508326 RepID=UPI001ADC85E5|nr:ABC transporter ATP-binding protein [Nocardioides sp. 503]
MSAVGRALRVLARGSRDHPGPAAVATTAGLVNGGTMVLGAAAVGWTTDHLVLPVLDGRPVGAATWWAGAGVILGVSAVRCGTIWVRGVATGRVQHRAQAATRRAVVRRYLHLDLAWHREHPPGRLLAHAVSDVDAVWSPVQWLYFALGMVFMLVGALAQLALTAPALGTVGLLLVAGVLVLNVVYQRLLTPRARDGQAARGDVARTAHESIEAGPVVRSLGLAGAEDARFAPEVERVREANTRMAAISAVFDPLLELLPTVAVLAVLGIGSRAVSAGDLTLGSLVGVCYLLLTVSIPLSVLSRFLSILPLAAAGHERVEAVLDAPTATYGVVGGAGPDGPALLEVRGADVVRGEATLLHAVDLTVEPGTVCAVVGATGAGKTTLVDLVCGQIGPSRGEVLVDGRPLDDLDLARRAATLGLVGQSPFLFSTTIRDNLALDGHPREGLRAYTDTELWTALEVADAADFVGALPAGLDSVVGERGATLSGGQRQRLCLARALLRRPRLLVLDDATSALDPRVELRVLARLRALVDDGGPTVLLVANRHGSLAVADRVVFLADGRVVDAGTHDELRERHADFRDIVSAYDGGRTDDEDRAVLAG